MKIPLTMALMVPMATPREGAQANQVMEELRPSLVFKLSNAFFSQNMVPFLVVFVLLN